MQISRHLMARLMRKGHAKLWTVRAIQLPFFVIGGIAAFLLRFDFSVPLEWRDVLWTAVAIGVVSKVAMFQCFGLGNGMWRYFAAADLIRVTGANVAASLIAAAAILAIGPAKFSSSVLAIDFLLSMLLATGLRVGTRLSLEIASRTRAARQKRIFIYGAGSTGALLLNEARTNPAFQRLVCGFIDDDTSKHHMHVNGVPVRGNGASLAALVADQAVEEVLIAIPSADGSDMRRIIGYCQSAGVVFRTMPSIPELVAGRGMAAQIRDVAMEDILGRNAVELDRGRISTKLRGKVALVTGAAGSIGSELCRQIAEFEPAAMVAFEMAETSLFHLEQEIARRFPHLPFHPEIGSVQNPQRLREVFQKYHPAVIYHAAAYKHVPLMESHVVEAVENNVLGTYNVAAAAADCGADDFVMISSDKAVKPASVMGATKRVAELVVRSLQNGGPRYVSVRFGNVLGSNGSVVPTFQRQIARGGPVTITHPEMQRYFMTIPEAAQLVLEASTIGRGGEIFVLDMGRPVRIVDLARQLIALSGLRPDEDIALEFVGARPGEKLVEELNLSYEHTVPTRHDKIRVFAGETPPLDRMAHHLGVLRSACERRDARALIVELKRMVPDYQISRDLLLWLPDPALTRLAAVLDRDSEAAADAGLPPIPALPAIQF